ncbi:ferrochelatase [Sporolactobacillus vineae]|uniref:ferrochelatase n=1 Tax=Sporolactobacillus vineae TaxID=444463 RepID=UPI0002882CA2|nr:ferrochelatase [Sporolactobacillus vineae]
MSDQTIGLLVMAYGTPERPDQIEAYYTHIRHGRKPSEPALQNLIARYRTIGGVSPLAEITRAQGERLTEKLNRTVTGKKFKLYLGMKHTAPFIEDAVSQMAGDGVKEAIGLILAPHYSDYSVRLYMDRAQAAAQAYDGLKIHMIDDWYDEPSFIAFWARQIRKELDKIGDLSKTAVIFSAHSLPVKIIQNGDPYPGQVKETAQLIADALHLKRFAVGWQSAGRTGEPWIGPDVRELTRQFYHESGCTAFVYCPIGFIADHLEVLYDNDQVCRQLTEELGAAYYRPAMPNADPQFIACLATIVARRAVQLDREDKAPARNQATIHSA